MQKIEKKSFGDYYAFCKVRFKIGEGNYLNLPTRLVVHATIIYKLIIKDLAFIPDEFKHFYIFAIPCLLIYLVLGILGGEFHIRSKWHKKELEAKRAINPIYDELFTKVDKLLEGDERYKQGHRDGFTKGLFTDEEGK